MVGWARTLVGSRHAESVGPFASASIGACPSSRSSFLHTTPTST
ncbi:hypothetical protein ACFPRL_23710 [Pseudoclavibacter helvolus]